MTRTLSTDEVLGLLGISRSHLRVSQLQTPRTIDRPWTCYGGTGRRVRYRWLGAEAVLRWWQEVCAWRRSSDEATAGASAGETPTGPADPGNAPVHAPRASSGVRPKSARRSVGGGGLPPLRELLHRGSST